jgi:hypothetical protein
VSRVKPANVRFYVDADVMGLAKILVGLRNDVTHPADPGGIHHKRERPPCPITTPAVSDELWIPEVSRRGWLIITRDRKIQELRRELEAVREHSARMVALSGPEAGSNWGQLEIVMSQWRAIERLGRARPIHPISQSYQTEARAT